MGAVDRGPEVPRRVCGSSVSSYKREEEIERERERERERLGLSEPAVLPLHVSLRPLIIFSLPFSRSSLIRYGEAPEGGVLVHGGDPMFRTALGREIIVRYEHRDTAAQGGCKWDTHIQRV